MKIGQAIEYKNEHSIVVRGVITNKYENYIEYFEVKSADRYTRCYDDVGAVRETDADKVRLKDCPTPFYRLCRGKKGGVYALADVNNPQILTKEQCEKYHVTVLDNGATISKRDMHEIFHHPWIDEMQKQKIMERRKGININIIYGDEEKEDDMEY